MKEKIIKSSGNVFADLGLENADELYIKADLIAMLGDAIKNRKLTQIEAADLIGISQPKLSELLKGKDFGYSVERLLRFLHKLKIEIEIKLTDNQTKQTRSTLVPV
ncbi:MAG: helix-turn-helix domain-containing protein [Candidatus Melainabacteria bacterium]|jgi:predicted XRE-type DNA-binding protein